MQDRRGSLQTQLENARVWLRDLNLAEVDRETLSENAKPVHEIGSATEQIGQEARRLIGPPLAPQTPQENKVMSLLSNRRDVIDLTELVLSAGNELGLEDLMDGLLGLYRGNQIIIKVHRRG
jgi:hypothetical protein